MSTTAWCPQGSILSPLLSNIYLHYVLDVWKGTGFVQPLRPHQHFSRRVRRQCQGEAYYFRFADDFLACFQYKGEAESFRHQLEDRSGRSGTLEGFGLKLAMEKTHCLEFGRYARENAYKRGEKPKEFTFLGFTHYCGKTWPIPQVPRFLHYSGGPAKGRLRSGAPTEGADKEASHLFLRVRSLRRGTGSNVGQ